MKIWKIESTEPSMVVIPLDHEKDAPQLNLFVGESLRDTWEPVRLKVYKKGKHKDFPHLLMGS